MPKKHSYEYVKQYFEEQGCELLEGEYKNSYTKMRYRCECGNISEICFSSFKKGRRCKKCGGNEKFTLEFVKGQFKKMGCELLETEYKNALTPMKYKCECGNITKISFSHFKKGRRCKKCGYKIVSGKRKLPFECVKQCFEDEGCKLLEDKYLNNKTLMQYRCSCGEISKISFTYSSRF